MTYKEAKYNVALYLKCWCDKDDSDEYIEGMYEANVFTQADKREMRKAFLFFKRKLLKEMGKYKIFNPPQGD